MITTLKSTLIELLGSYVPVVTVLSDGTEIVQYDIAYIFSGIIFVCVVVSVFKIIGGLICKQ